MARFYFVLTFAVVAIALIALATETKAHYDRVLLTDVQTLTLFQNRYTAARRTSPVPQLKCIGGREMCQPQYLPSAVQCYNMGTDGVDVQWRCDAELDNDVAFDAVHVSCEGFTHPDDPYVLEGSCGLEYKLKYTKAHHEKMKNTPNRHYNRNNDYRSSTHTTDDGSETFKWLLFIAVLAIFIVYCARKPRRNPLPTAPPMYEHPIPTTASRPSGLGFAEGVAVGAVGGAAASHILHSHNTSTSHQYTSNPSPPTSHRPPRSSSPSTHTSSGFGTTSRR